MKVTVKTLKGNQFDLLVEGTSSVVEVKRLIEEKQGKDFPAESQLLIYKGKVLSDDKTLAEHDVSENGFLVVMTTKTKQPSGGSSSSVPAGDTTASAPPQSASVPAPSASVAPASGTASSPIEPAIAASAPVVAAGPTAATAGAAPGDLYGQTASNLVAGQALESTIARIMDMGGGVWDRDTVVRALHAAYNNPDRAIDYLYSGIPETAEPAPPVARPPAPAAAGGIAPAAPAAPAPAQLVPSGPNAAPLDLFPQGMPAVGGGAGALDFLRNNPQFQALRGMVQANPQILQPMLQELGKQNPQLLGLINNNQQEFLRLINEPGAEGGEGDLFGGVAAPQPQAINVTAEEREAIGRLEALGFERALVIEAFFACDRNEQLAANYLLEHAAEFDD